MKCGECPRRSFIPVTDEVIESHLRGEDRIWTNGRGGDFVAGVYPQMFDDTCKFLAVDADDEKWSTDALAFLASCRELDVPAALESTRSGNGGRVWPFFAAPVAAAEAGRLGTLLLTAPGSMRWIQNTKGDAHASVRDGVTEFARQVNYGTVVLGWNAVLVCLEPSRWRVVHVAKSRPSR